MIARCALAALGAMAAGCGDNRPPPDDPLTSVSGARLVLQKYRYDDGTEQVAGNELYDQALHARCAPRLTVDDTTRCVPLADDALYRDAACTARVGLARTVSPPTHFVERTARPGGAQALRVFRAGAAAAPLTESYAIVSGACTGPTPVATGEQRLAFDVDDELDPGELVELRDEEVGDGRIGLAFHTSADGLRVAFGVRDRELGAACAPRVQADGGVRCEPSDAAVAAYYRDPACAEPVLAVSAAAGATIARLIEPSGCASYHRVGPQLATAIYRRDGAACTPATAPVDAQLYALAAPIQLAELARTLEDAPGRRLRQIVLAHDGVKFVDDRLYDSARGGDCLRRALRDATRCVPATLAASVTLFTAGCVDQVRVAELPARTCEPFAHATTSRPFQIRPIGAPVVDPLFRLDGAACQPYAPPPGSELRALGPAVDLTTFVSALYYGERPR